MTMRLCLAALAGAVAAAGCSTEADQGGAQAAARTCQRPSDAPVRLAAGTFEMGEGGLYAEEGPARRVAVDAFAIDPHEVTNRQFAAFVHATTSCRGGARLTPEQPFNARSRGASARPARPFPCATPCCSQVVIWPASLPVVPRQRLEGRTCAGGRSWAASSHYSRARGAAGTGWSQIWTRIEI